MASSGVEIARGLIHSKAQWNGTKPVEKRKLMNMVNEALKGMGVAPYDPKGWNGVWAQLVNEGLVQED